MTPERQNECARIMDRVASTWHDPLHEEGVRDVLREGAACMREQAAEQARERPTEALDRLQRYWGGELLQSVWPILTSDIGPISDMETVSMWYVEQQAALRRPKE